MYSEIIHRIAKDNNIIVIQIEPGDKHCQANGIEKYINQSWCCGNKIWLGIFDEPELHFLSFFHEAGHILDLSAWDSDENATLYQVEKAAWDVGYKLAHKYGITFSKEARLWGMSQLETYYFNRTFVKDILGTTQDMKLFLNLSV